MAKAPSTPSTPVYKGSASFGKASQMSPAQKTGLRSLGARSKGSDLKTARMNPNNSSIYKTLMQGPAPKGSKITTQQKKKMVKGLSRPYSK